MTYNTRFIVGFENSPAQMVVVNMIQTTIIGVCDDFGLKILVNLVYFGSVIIFLAISRCGKRGTSSQLVVMTPWFYPRFFHSLIYVINLTILSWTSYSPT